MRRMPGAALVRTQGMASLGLAVVSVSVAARAQTAPSIDARSWQPSTDPDASLVLEPPSTPGPWQWNVGVWTQYAQDPVALETRAGTTLRPVEHEVGVDVVAGVGLGERVDVGVDLPVALWQDGDSNTLPTSALGDLALLGKVSLIRNVQESLHSGFGLAALGGVSLPTGDRASYLGDGAVGAHITVLAEYAVGVGEVRAELGYAVRGSTRTEPDDSGPTFGNSIPWAFGIGVRPKVFTSAFDNGDRQLWEIAAHGSLPGGPVAPFGWGRSGASLLSPAMLAIDDRVALGHNREVSVLAGADFGLDDAVGVPSVRAVISLSWAPRSHDLDGDGVPDEQDQCPDLPEDRDGIQDADGCPEDDADGDGILDTSDACPLVPGVPSSDPKKNGCPGEAPTAPPSAPAEEKTGAAPPGPTEKTP